MTTQKPISKSPISDAFLSKNAEGNYLSNSCFCARCKNITSFSFTGKEKDPETGYSYFGSRYLDHELMTCWLSVDPMADKYPSISPYAYCAWNPVKLVDPTGDTIDISGLSEAEKAVYENSIKQLIKSPLFAYYYGELQSSTKTYKIQEGPGRGGEGSFEPESNTISANLDNLCALSQEMFHAYQTDGGFYTSEDASVRETEGDLVSMLVMADIGYKSGSYGEWANTFVKYQYDVYRETLAEESFILDFDKMVDDRINYYLNTENPPKSYIQPNSHKRPRALLKALENASNQYQQWKSNPSMKPSGKVVIRAEK